jgi:hypothetical protein
MLVLGSLTEEQEFSDRFLNDKNSYQPPEETHNRVGIGVFDYALIESLTCLSFQDESCNNIEKYQLYQQ